ncbi:MAG: hypothetical protein ACRDUV_17985 [Pseudonocardiaceae bacterium]
MIDVPEQRYRPGERDRLIALCRRTDDDKRCTLLVVSEADGSWSFYGLGALAGVKLGKADTVALADSILRRTR